METPDLPNSVIGRRHAVQKLRLWLTSRASQFIAVYGRRRIGKTYLIRNIYHEHLIFEIEGLHDGPLKDQLLNFTHTLQRFSRSPIPFAPPSSWVEAFDMLAYYIENHPSKRKKVIFFDEFPWFDTPKSRFLPAFANFWNQRISRLSNCVLVICGSAASWMIQKILKNKGGLHNRVTGTIRLEPFNLYETERYFKYRKLAFSRMDILRFYIVLGGVPYYLRQINKGLSFTQNVDALCFEKDGALTQEFDHLFKSLFRNSENHEKIIHVLTQKRKGLTRSEIVQSTKLKSGGTLTQILEELIESGFVLDKSSFNNSHYKDLYRINDEFSIFHSKFMRKSRQRSWQAIAQSQSWISWSGFAFEAICMKHIDQIRGALQIKGIDSYAYSWIGSTADQGAQIDLLIDRADHVINICEIKFSSAPFIIDKRYAKQLQQKMQTFRDVTKTTKSIFLTMITPHGLVANAHSKEQVQNDLVMDDLFRPTS